MAYARERGEDHASRISRRAAFVALREALHAPARVGPVDFQLDSEPNFGAQSGKTRFAHSNSALAPQLDPAINVENHVAVGDVAACRPTGGVSSQINTVLRSKHAAMQEHRPEIFHVFMEGEKVFFCRGLFCCAATCSFALAPGRCVARHRTGPQSRHTQGRAIDMSAAWTGDLAILAAGGAAQNIATLPRTVAGNLELHAVGAGYGVLKLVADPPHWSDDGH